MTDTDKFLKEISDKLDLLMRLVAADIVKSANIEQDKIEMLSSSGFRPVEIAKLLNKTPGNINVQLNLIRKKKASKTQATKQVQDSKSKGEQKSKNIVNSSKTKGSERNE